MIDRIDILVGKYRRLRKIDRHCVVFGASEHRYRTKQWSRSNLDELSQRVGAKLPRELELWLLRVGSGAGPNYNMVPEPSEDFDDIPEEEFHGDFPQLIDVRLEDLQNLIDAALEQIPNGRGFLHPPEIVTRAYLGGEGLLSLGFSGCTFHHVMPLRGELKGKVFSRCYETVFDEEDKEYGSTLWPEGFSVAYPHWNFEKGVTVINRENAADMFGFLDWIEYWLDSSLYLVENYGEYERQLNDWREEHLGWRDRPPGLLGRLMRGFSS